jgi:ketosteroid isomerase-like protein
MCASVIHAGCMSQLTEDDRRQIEQIHSRWMNFEVARENSRLLAFCADDIEFLPPDAPPVLGRAAGPSS